MPDQPAHSETHTPRGTGAFGLKLFLASLSMLFGASIAAYGVIRWMAAHPPQRPVDAPASALFVVRQPIPFGTLTLPHALWASTLAIILSSVTVQMAIHAIRRDRQDRFRVFILLTAALGLVFVAIQGPSLYRLLQTHWAMTRENIHLYGLVLMLIALHAAHVIGGLVPLGTVTVQTFRGRYSAARYDPVKYCATYWHFLDVVWLILFGTLYFLG